MDPHAAPRADDHATEASERIAELLDDVPAGASLLTDYANGAGFDVDRLAVRGTPDELDVWRSTRAADAELQALVAAWREHWRLAALSDRKLANLRPRGLDVYAWEAPEECDAEQVRLGATWVQYAGAVQVTRVHVDLIRIAQQATTFRLLGPTQAVDLLGVDGIVQEGHPLRVGTCYSGAVNAYRPGAPTWFPPKPEPQTPHRYQWTGHEYARWLNDARADGRVSADGTMVWSS